MIDGVTPFVYLMQRSDSGSWKIGFSIDPFMRRKGLVSTNPGVKFKIEKVWQRADAYRIEKLSHIQLRLRLDLRVDGRETFRGSRRSMIAAVEGAIRVADGETS